MIETKDIYWLAGLLEGEGCFTTRRSGVRQSSGAAQIQLSMSDKDVIDRAAQLLGSNVHEHQPPGNRKIQYRTVVVTRMAIAWMMTLYPLMSARRQTRIREVLITWRRGPRWGKWDRRVNKTMKERGE